MEALLTSISTESEDSDRKESNSDTIDEKSQPAEKEKDEDILEMPGAMRRVDWRWAVAKGYLNKETNEWNESMGGQKAYLKQRNDRMVSRSIKADFDSIVKHFIVLDLMCVFSCWKNWSYFRCRLQAWHFLL
jgi:hypothetical protein